MGKDKKIYPLQGVEPGTPLALTASRTQEACYHYTRRAELLGRASNLDKRDNIKA